MKDRPHISKGDIAHAATKGILSEIPLAGGLASEIFNLVIAPPLAKRRDKWMESIAEGLKDLESKIEGFKIEYLVGNDSFITTVMHASQTALKNHQEEKLNALRNAVLNAAIPSAPEEDLQLMFLSFVDTLTSWHIRILKYFDDPKRWGKEQNIKFHELEFGAPAHALEDAFPELKGKRAFYDLIIRDLYSRGLMSIESLRTTMTKQGIFASRTTDIGERFIAFIEFRK
ncbi:MAG: hypothetical protein WBC70_13925 [Candidatus Aminicenantales bacterium]